MKHSIEKLPLLAGLRAARANLLPGLVLQAAMACIMIAYYHYVPARDFLGRVAEWKRIYGYGFTLILSGLAGGVLPEVLRVAILQRGTPTRKNLRSILFNIPFWALLGCCVDTFYRFQTVLFGPSPDFWTVFKKVAFDQCVYTTTFGTPSVVWGYEWLRRRFSLKGIHELFTASFYRRRIVPALIAGWAMWIPLVTIVYLMPPLLQLPVSALASSFWALLVTYITASKPAAAKKAELVPVPL